ncbi:hypothetical protein PR202_ga23946 [Eleusine coracana subsp. coracana]|uniref:Uncharacterized protein n=1 Tax=Eleusine coracana subsp. coracana TaxID=191504 RepID=A0AAV5D5K7_ELECO|nr:hypothetical protein PR202_ga23946 [Eleusine coracana subsp. coracana]
MEQAGAMDADAGGVRRSAAVVADLLHGFLAVQQRRAEAYSMLRRCQLRITDMGTPVLEMISLLSMPEFCRGDLADLLKVVQAHEKEKLHLTAKIQVLKKAGRPSERLVSHEDCRSRNMAQHVCVHVKEITEDAGTEDAEADAEYDAALKEAIQGVQEAVTNINEHMEEVRYEIEALEAETIGSKWTEVEEAFPSTLSIK